MPGLPPSPPRAQYFTRKDMLDWELLTVIAHQIFVLRLALSVRVVQRRFFEERRTRIPFKEFGYPDLISYLSSVKGISVTMNSTNGQFQVEADNQYDLSHLNFIYVDPSDDDDDDDDEDSDEA